MSKNASAQEVTAARAFLKFLGRDWRNNELVLAVIVWARVSSGRLSGSLGHNPFKLYVKGSTFVPYGYGGKHAASFATLTQAFIAAAKALKYLAAHYPKASPITIGGKSYKGYTFADVLAAFKSGKSSEVLSAIAMSNWKKDHYGLKIVDGQMTSNLFRVAATYDGIITPEAEAAAAAEKARQEAEQRAWEAQERARKAALAKFRRRPKQLPPPPRLAKYTDPYAVGRSYAEKHEPYELPE